MKRSCVPELARVFAFVVGLAAGCSGDDGSTQLFDYGSCPALIECAADLAPQARDEYEQAYGPGGSCWANVSSWSACKDFCRTTLEGLNLIAMATGDSCGTCSSDADCSSFGGGARCESGLCAGGSGSNADDGETGEESEPETDTNTDADTDTNEDSNDTADDSDDCQPVPQACQDFLECIAVVVPGADVSEFEPGGACWCGTTAKANECVDVCIEQLEAAAQAYPNVPECTEEVNPCPGGEGCGCLDSYDCKGNLICEDFFDKCVVPEFGDCYGDDPLCPATGCPNGYAYFDKDDDGQPDFASCKVPCNEELGAGECTDVALHPHYGGDPECMWGGYFNWNNGLMCVGVCDFDSDCPDGSICILSRCWYDLP